jgi:RNA polymerase sigma factor (sigma-70 family)
MRRRTAATLEGLELLYREQRGAFERVAGAVAGDPNGGADAVHDAFVLAVRHRARFRGDAPLEAWVWRIVVNEARKRRAETARVAPEAPDGVPVTPDGANGWHSARRARALVAALPERQRHVLFLRYYADLDYASIAAALGIKTGTVAATLNAAHAALRTQLQEVEP